MRRKLLEAIWRWRFEVLSGVVYPLLLIFLPYGFFIWSFAWPFIWLSACVVAINSESISRQYKEIINPFLKRKGYSWWGILSFFVLAPFLAFLLCFCAVFLFNIGAIFWNDFLIIPLFWIVFSVGTGLLLLFTSVIIINSELISKWHKEIIKHYFFQFLIFLMFLIFAWFIMHVSVQLEFLCQGCQNDSKYWLSMLIACIVLYLIAIASLSVLGHKYEVVSKWNKKIEYHFFAFIDEIKDSYMRPRMVISFILISLVTLFIILLAGYWVNNSSTPRIKSSKCEKENIICSQPLPNGSFKLPFASNLDIRNEESNTTDSPAVQLEAETNITRNKWLWIFGFIALGLTLWGRAIAHQQNKQTQKQIKLTGDQIELTRKANAGERMQEALKNIYDESIGTRIAGSKILVRIANDSESIDIALTILNAFMRYPYFTKEQEKKLKKEKNDEINYTSVKGFLVQNFLREDVQEVANSISRIYQGTYEYSDDISEKIKEKEVSLPRYFWQNKKKETVNFQGINLSREKMEKAYLDNAILTEANLSEANLNYAILSNAELHGANLSSAHLKGANLSAAILSNAKLQEAILSDANLEHANLMDADLSDAKLRNANLSKANFSNAKLSRAEITSVSFKGVKGLSKEQILSAKWGADRKGGPPILDDILMKDRDIKEWLQAPYYVNADKSDSKDAILQERNENIKVKKLSEIMPIENLWQYKVHCGDRSSQGIEPLDVFIKGEWDRWQLPWGERNRFNRKYIFTIVRFYPERDKSTWLFAGIYEIINKKAANDYEVELTDQWREYIGKLKIELDLQGRNRYRNLEGIYGDMEVVEILSDSYIE